MGMRMGKRMWAVLLAVCLLAGPLPGGVSAEEAGTGGEPEALAASGSFAIESLALEPGEDTARVGLTAGGACTLRAALYGEDGRLLGVGERSVEGTGEQTLTVRLSARAPERFTARAFLLDGGDAPLCGSCLLDRTGAGRYAVTGLTVENGRVSAGVSAAADCTLSLRFLSDDGSGELFAMSVPVKAGAASAEAALSQTLPGYFRVEAVLEQGQALSEPYLCLRYASAYQKGPEDYPAERVLDFGGEGFAVLPEGAVECGEARETAGGYAVSLSAVPAAGDVAVLTIGGAAVPVKVKSASVQGGQTVIVPDGDASLADLYDALRVDASLDLGGIAGAKARSGVTPLSGGPVEVPIQKTFQLGPGLTLESTGTLRLEVHVFFDKETDPDYLEQTKTLTGEGSLTLKSAGEASTEMPDLISENLTLDLAETPSIPLGTTGLAVNANVGVPLSFSITAGSTVTARYTFRKGDVYQYGKGYQKIDEFDLSFDRVTHGGGIEEYSASLGVQASLELGSVVPAVPLKASLDFQVGGRYVSKQDARKEDNGVRHACRSCYDERTSVFQELTATLSADLGKIKIPLAKLPVPLVEETLWQGYFSYSSDPDSPFQGLARMGDGRCPNRSCRTAVTALTLEGVEAVGAPVTVINRDTHETAASGKSSDMFYLYNGSYTASAVINGRTFETGFAVNGAAQSVQVKENKCTLNIYVRDKDTAAPLSGAAVRCLDAGGTLVKETSADSEGWCAVLVYPGIYRLTVEREGYNSETREVSVTGGSAAVLNVGLERTEPYASLTVNLVDGTTGAAPAEDTFLTVEGPDKLVRTTTGGRAELEHLIPGTYTVTAAATKAYAAAGGTVTLAPGEAGTLTIRLAAGTGTVKGTVTDSEGKAISGAEVTASADGKEALSAATASDGSYTMALPAGTYTLKASAGGYVPESGTVTVEKDRTSEQSFQLKAEEADWSFDEATGVLTIRGSGPMKNYDTSSYTNGKPPWYGIRSKIRAAVVEEGVTSVGDAAFYGCQRLVDVTLPESVTRIGKSAFVDCRGLTGVDIPNSVTSIGGGAFSGCSGLTSVDIPSGVTSIETGSFFKCGGLTSVSIPSSVTSIGNSAFYLCSALTSVDIPNGVTGIGDGAFSGCSALTSVSIPSSVTGIGESAFFACKGLTSVELPDGLTQISMGLFGGTGLKCITIPGSVTSIGMAAFSNCGSLTSVHIPSGVTNIGGQAFEGCSSLADVNIPSGVKYISGSTFSGCGSLTSVTIPDSIIGIGNYAFENCSGLTSVTIPDSVQSMGNYAFSGSGLTSVTIPDSLTSTGNYAFRNCGRLTSVMLPDSMKTIGSYAFSSCRSLTSIRIPSGVTSIGNGAFEGCSSLTGVNIPSGVKYISGSTFSRCSSLTSVTLPDGVTRIENYAFRDCGSLTSVEIPNGVMLIRDGVFQRCSSLASVTLPDSVTSIGKHAFTDCGSLTSVTVPDSVTSIGESAFSGCGDVTVYYGGTQEQWDALEVSLEPGAAVICTG